MRKSCISLLIILSCVLFSSPIFAFAEGTAIEINTAQNLSALKPGDILTVNIIVKNVTNLVGGELTLTYNPTYLALRSRVLRNNDMIDFTALDSVSNDNLIDEPGKVRFIFGLDKTVSPLTGEHVIATLSFEALLNGNGSLSIDSTSKLISEEPEGFFNEMDFSTELVDYTILGTGNVSGIVRNENNEPVTNATVKLIKDDLTLYSTTSGVDGSYSFTDVVEGQYVLEVECEPYKVFTQTISIIGNGDIEVNVSLIEGIVGDVNDDGRITLEDLVFVANYYGLSINDEEWTRATSIADINKDDIVDILDLVFISRKLEL